MLDAYTVRKIAPKLLIAAIAINISIYLCVAAIDITNVIGHGLGNFLTAPFATANNLNLNLDTGAGNSAGALIIAGALSGAVLVALAVSGGGMAMIFLSLLPIIFIVLAVLITIVIRQTLLVLLTIISPLAFACLVLPGTEKFFKQWWDLFLKALMVYPIVAALFAVSNIMAIISLGAASNGQIDNTQGAPQILTGIVLTFMPLFLVPFAFRFAGGAIGTIMNGAKGMGSGLSRLAAQNRQQGLQKGWKNLETGRFVRGDGRFASALNRRGAGAAAFASGKTGFLRGVKNIRNGGMGDWKERRGLAYNAATLPAALEHMKKLEEEGDAVANDDDLTEAAAMAGKGKAEIRKYLTESMTNNRYEGESYTDRNGNLVEAGHLIDGEGDKTDERELKRFGTEAEMATAVAGVQEYRHQGGAVARHAALIQNSAIGPGWDRKSGQRLDGSWGEMSANERVRTAEAVMSDGNADLMTRMIIQRRKGADKAQRDDLKGSSSADVQATEAAVRFLKGEGTMKEFNNAQYAAEQSVISHGGVKGYFGNHKAAKEEAHFQKARLEKAVEARNGGAAESIRLRKLGGAANETKAAKVLKDTHQKWIDTVADTAGFHEAISNAPPENTDKFEELVMGMKIDGKSMGEVIGENIMTEEFQNRKNYYRNIHMEKASQAGSEQDILHAGAVSAAGAGGGQPPAPGPHVHPGG